MTTEFERLRQVVAEKRVGAVNVQAQTLIALLGELDELRALTADVVQSAADVITVSEATENMRAFVLTVRQLTAGLNDALGGVEDVN